MLEQQACAIDPYEQFLKSKVRLANRDGFDVQDDQISPYLKPHNKLMVKFLVTGGRRACFAAFGLHKTVTLLEAVRITLLNTGGRGLIVCPLNVRQEFINDAVNILKWETPPKFIRSIEEAGEAGIYLTNYETIREGKLDPRLFQVGALDEVSALRGGGKTKTFREFMRLYTGDGGPLGNRKGTECVPYRFIATATPAPNNYIELLLYADFLGVMDVSQAKTRFFKRDSTKADVLTLHKHKEEEFWLWVASWSVFVLNPSDITGNPADDEGYILPALDIRWHEIQSDHSTAGMEKDGQYRMLKNVQIGLEGAAQEKRESLMARLAKLMEIRAEDPDAHRIIWHDLEPERKAIERSIPDRGVMRSVYGNQPLEEREQIIADFSNGRIQELAAKPMMLGSGCNLQRHCHWAIYLGIGFKFNDFIQSIHRILRFLQQHQVRIDLIYTEAESHIRKQLERKWKQHNELVKRMTQIIRQYGLSHVEMAQHLTRKMGIERIEVKGQTFTCVQNDNVREVKRMKDNSVGLIHTSWPFTNQYEYSPNYADFGHSDNPSEFFKQMDFLTPEEFRVLMPGRIYALHVKDRIIPGGLNGLGFQTTYPFHLDCIHHMIKHGFGYLGMKTIVTDVVRENNQTYRLGWTEQCKDGSKMGVGMPEYLLLFRKPPSDTSKAYADIPVFKEKPLQMLPDGSTRKFIKKTREPIVPGTGYSRSKWQIDAHGYARSSGNRLLNSEELMQMKHAEIYQTFREWSRNCVYNYDHHVKISETLEAAGKLPSGFMLLQPDSWSDDVWADITRMLTLNGSQWSKGREMHICPLQFDIVDRVILQMSNKGEVVLDSFAGLFTVPYRAILHGRVGFGIELNPVSFLDGVQYCKDAELKMNSPSLFDLEELSDLKEAI